MHATFACCHAGTTGAHIELHANQLVLILPKLDGAPLWELNAPFAVFPMILAFCLALASVLTHRLLVLWIWLESLAQRS